MIACDFCAIKLRNFYDFRDADLDAPICKHHVGMMNPVLFFSDFDAVALGGGKIILGSRRFFANLVPKKSLRNPTHILRDDSQRFTPEQAGSPQAIVLDYHRDIQRRADHRSDNRQRGGADVRSV